MYFIVLSFTIYIILLFDHLLFYVLYLLLFS